jgi:hypothetical protein
MSGSDSNTKDNNPQESKPASSNDGHTCTPEYHDHAFEGHVPNTCNACQREAATRSRVRDLAEDLE